MDYSLMLEASFQEATVGILIVDKQGNIISTNPYCRKLFLYSEAEFRTLTVEDLLPDSFRKIHQKYRSGYLENPRPRSMGTHQDLFGLKKDGTEFPVAISLSHTKHDGELYALAYVSDDTIEKQMFNNLKDTEYKLAEKIKQLQEAEKVTSNLNEALEQKVELRTSELEDTVNQLLQTNRKLEESESLLKKSLNKEKELNQLKSRFVSMASHEFRTPLSTIKSSASLIGKYTKEEQHSKREKHVNRIKSSVNNLTGILNDFLSLSKIEEGKEKIELEDIDIGLLCDSVVDDIKGLMAADQTLKHSMQPEHIILNSDKRILKNILFNLLSNAIKYGSDSGMIDCTVTQLQDTTTFKVRDNGIGIPKEEQVHLFDRFFRASNVENIQGTGLGLNIVKRYVELLGGNITFESIEGVGTTFTVVITHKQ